MTSHTVGDMRLFPVDDHALFREGRRNFSGRNRISCVEQKYVRPLFQSIDQTRPAGARRLTDRDKTVLRFVFQGELAGA